MKGLEDRARFNTVLVWLSKRMRSAGGSPVEIDADLQDDYFDALVDIRIERLEWAAKHIFKSRTWFPMPNELRDAAIFAPSTVLNSLPFNQQQIPERTSYNETLANEAFKKVMALFGDNWGLPTNRRQQREAV